MTKNRRNTIPLLTRIRNGRATSAARRQLAAELATFTSPADRLELQTILDRADDREAEQVRTVLTGTRSRAATSGRSAAHIRPVAPGSVRPAGRVRTAGTRTLRWLDRYTLEVCTPPTAGRAPRPTRRPNR